MRPSRPPRSANAVCTALGGGCLVPGRCLPQNNPPPVNRESQRGVKKNSLAPTSLRAVKIAICLCGRVVSKTNLPTLILTFVDE